MCLHQILEKSNCICVICVKVLRKTYIVFFQNLEVCYILYLFISGEDIVFLATDINLPGAVDWVMMQSCFGHHFMLVLEKQEKYDGHQQFFAIVQLIGSRKQAENFAYRYILLQATVSCMNTCMVFIYFFIFSLFLTHKSCYLPVLPIQYCRYNCFLTCMLNVSLFCHRLELNGLRRRLTWEATPRSIHEGVQSAIMNSDCLVFDTSIAQLFADNGNLGINVTISMC